MQQQAHTDAEVYSVVQACTCTEMAEAASGKPQKTAYVQHFENLYPIRPQNKDIFQDLNYHRMLKAYVYYVCERICLAELWVE